MSGGRNKSKQCSLGEAGGALSVFSIFIVLGRIVCSKLTLTINHASIVLVLVWSQTAMLFLMWNGDGLFVLVILAISGVTFSGKYPTLLALTNVLFPECEGTSLGLLSTMGGARGNCHVLVYWLCCRVDQHWVRIYNYVYSLFSCFGFIPNELSHLMHEGTSKKVFKANLKRQFKEH